MTVESDDDDEGPSAPKDLPDPSVVFNDILADMKINNPFDPKATAKYCDFKAVIDSIRTPGTVSNEDVEEVITQTKTIPIDPVTKRPVAFAIKNKKCGHIYDKTSFEEYLKLTRPRCPFMGCSNRELLKNDSVEDDLVTNALIARIRSSRS